MKRLFVIAIATALCLMLTAPALAARDDYEFDLNTSHKTAADGSDILSFTSYGQGEARVYFLSPVIDSDAWSVRFRVTTFSSSENDCPIVRFAFYAGNEDGGQGDLLGLALARTSLSNNQFLFWDAQEFDGSNWLNRHNNTEGWKEGSENNAFTAEITKRAGDNRLHFVFRNTNGDVMESTSTAPYSDVFASSMMYFSIWSESSNFEVSRIVLRGFEGGDSGWNPDTGDNLLPIAVIVLAAGVAGALLLRRKSVA